MQADDKEVLKYLRMAKGQLEGIIKMVEEDRYCIDISNQLMASQAMINKVNKIVLKSHIDHCVKEAIKENDETKIDEVLEVLNKLIK